MQLKLSEIEYSQSGGVWVGPLLPPTPPPQPTPQRENKSVSHSQAWLKIIIEMYLTQGCDYIYHSAP